MKFFGVGPFALSLSSAHILWLSGQVSFPLLPQLSHPYRSTQSTFASITIIIINNLTKERNMLQVEQAKCGKAKRHVRKFTVTMV